MILKGKNLNDILAKSFGAYDNLTKEEQDLYSEITYKIKNGEALTESDNVAYKLILTKMKTLMKSIKIDEKKGGLRGEFCYKCEGKDFDITIHDEKKDPNIMRITCKKCGTILKLCHRSDLLDELEKRRKDGEKI